MELFTTVNQDLLTMWQRWLSYDYAIRTGITQIISFNKKI